MRFEDLKVGMKVMLRLDRGYEQDKYLVNSIIGDIVTIGGTEHVSSNIDWEKTAELNGFNANDVELNGLKANEVFIDESDHIALIEKQKHKHYFVDVSNIDKLDVYRVLERFNVTCPVLQHVSKKALCAGNRGHKDLREDIQNMIDSLNRKLEMMEEDNG